MLGFPAQTFNRADDLAGLRIEGRDAFAAAVSRENVLGFSVEQNNVRVRSDGDSLDYREGLQVEDDDRTRIAATDKAAPEIFGDGDAVNTGARDLADHRIRIEIEHYHFPVMGDVEAPGLTVSSEVIPRSAER